MSERAEHTAGPWRIGDAGRTVFGPPNGNPSPETVASGLTRANARLIASAPELLAACEAALRFLDMDSGTATSRAYLADTLVVKGTIRTAIRKATGGAA